MQLFRYIDGMLVGFCFNSLLMRLTGKIPMHDIVYPAAIFSCGVVLICVRLYKDNRSAV